MQVWYLAATVTPRAYSLPLSAPLSSFSSCLLLDPDSLLPIQAHFQTVEWTLITLFRVSTGDAWGDVMGALQLASGSRAPRIENDVWEYFTALFGGVEPSALVEGLTRDSDGVRVQVGVCHSARTRAHAHKTPA